MGEDVDYEWDPEKSETNFAKHGIRFDDAIIELDWNFALEVDDILADEPRMIGVLPMGRMLVVTVYTYRGDKVRLISIRAATKADVEKWKGAFYDA